MRILAISFAIVAFANLAQGATWEKSGEDYEKQTAQEKEKALWAEITSNETPNSWFSPLALSGLFLESMMPTLHWVGDTFENGWTGARNKYIHTVGNTATVKFTPVANNEGYTGIFESGADHGVIRLSAAK